MVAGGGEEKGKEIYRINGKCLGLSLLKVTQDVRTRPHAVGKNMDLKADRLGSKPSST